MNNTELINPYEGDTNLASRLFMHVHNFLYEQTERLLPKELELAEVWDVLDVACGLGRWTLDMARTYQDMDVVGLDLDPGALVLARMDARAWMLDNINFVEGDMYQMTELEDNAYDLVHTRFVDPVISQPSWPTLLRELVRISRPGGSIVWTESLSFESNSQACMRWSEMIQHAVSRSYQPYKTGQIMDMLLGDAGCRRVQKLPITIDLSTGTKAHTRIYRNLTYLLSILQLFLAQKGVAHSDEIDSLCQQMIVDLYSDTFSATWTLMTVVGEKPGQRGMVKR